MRREPQGPVPTIYELHKEDRWLWAYCKGRGEHGYGCSGKWPFAIAPYRIIFGGKASSNKIRDALRCPKCGHQGAHIYKPSFVNTIIGFQPWPDESEGYPADSTLYRRRLK